MKLLIILIASLSASVYSAECGKLRNLTYNPDTAELAGMTAYLDSGKVRITSHNSPNLAYYLYEELNYAEPYGLFICLDEFSTYKRTYAKRVKTYANVREYRIYRDGKLVLNSKDLPKIYEE